MLKAVHGSAGRRFVSPWDRRSSHRCKSCCSKVWCHSAGGHTAVAVKSKRLLSFRVLDDETEATLLLSGAHTKALPSAQLLSDISEAAFMGEPGAGRATVRGIQALV